MSDVSRSRGIRTANCTVAPGTNLARKATALDSSGRLVPVRQPREWRYQTRPSFKRVRGPLVDVFNEAEEVLIVVDLGGFTRGEIFLSRSPNRYILQATRGDQQFREFIDLPANVDLDQLQERLVNGVLEIVLPRRSNRRALGATRRSDAPER